MIATSEQIADLSKAFIKAQTKFGAAIKASQNPAFRSKYADLASVIDATLEHLNAEGIGVMQHPSLTWEGDDENLKAYVMVTTRLQHESGQWMQSDITIPAVQRDRFDAQSVGSAITYACRYALRSICTVPQEDDDANAASGVGSHEAAQEKGKEKIAELKAKVAKNAPQVPLNPSVAADQLVVYPFGEGFEITGESEVMQRHAELLLAYGKKVSIKTAEGPKAVVRMDADGLNTFQHIFCDERHGILTALKGPK